MQVQMWHRLIRTITTSVKKVHALSSDGDCHCLGDLLS